MLITVVLFKYKNPKYKILISKQNLNSNVQN